MLNWNKRVIIHQRDHRKKECMLCGDYLLRNFGWSCTMGWLREAAPHAEPDLQSRAGYSLCWSILSQLGAQISFTFLMLFTWKLIIRWWWYLRRVRLEPFVWGSILITRCLSISPWPNWPRAFLGIIPNPRSRIPTNASTPCIVNLPAPRILVFVGLSLADAVYQVDHAICRPSPVRVLRLLIR